MFEDELREQLTLARLALARAREAGDEDEADAYRGRIRGLLRIAEHHGVDLPHEPEEETY